MSNSNAALIELILFSKEDSLSSECQFPEELVFWAMADSNLNVARKAISNYQTKISDQAISVDIILNLKITLTDLQSTTDKILLKAELTDNTSLSQVITDLRNSIRLAPETKVEKVTESGVVHDVIITTLVPIIVMMANTNSDVEDLLHQLEVFDKIANNYINDLLISNNFGDMLGSCIDATVMELQDC